MRGRLWGCRDLRWREVASCLALVRVRQFWPTCSANTERNVSTLTCEALSMDLTGLNWVIERINWLIGRFADREDRRIEQKQQAIDALLKALTETRIYFGTKRIQTTGIR